MIIIASVDSISFDELGSMRESYISASFWLAVFYRHVIGDRPNFGVVLADEQQRSLRQCGGHFSPCTYLAVGPLIHVSPPFENPFVKAKDHDIVIDCGMPLDVSQRFPPPWQPPPPHIDPDKLREGVWIAALGNIYFYPGPVPIRGMPTVYCKPIEASLIDMRPNSPTFGSIISWEFGKRLPHEPNVLPFPTVFVSFEILPSSADIGASVNMPELVVRSLIIRNRPEQ